MYIEIPYAAEAILYLPLPGAGDPDFQGSLTLVAGDATISKDGAAEANLNTLPSETQTGEKRYKITISATEATCKIGKVNLIDQTATKVFEDQSLIFSTYGHASAFDSRLASDVNVTQWNGTNVATPTVAGVPEVDVTHMIGSVNKARSVVNAVSAQFFSLSHTWYRLRVVSGSFDGDLGLELESHDSLFASDWNNQIGALDNAGAWSDYAGNGTAAIPETWPVIYTSGSAGYQENSLVIALEASDDDTNWVEIFRWEMAGRLTSATESMILHDGTIQTFEGNDASLTPSGKGGTILPMALLADGPHGGTSAVLTLERLIAESTTSGEPGIKSIGLGSADGIEARAGTSGAGIFAVGGTVAGDGISSWGRNDGHGINADGNGSGKSGIWAGANDGSAAGITGAGGPLGAGMELYSGNGGPDLLLSNTGLIGSSVLFGADGKVLISTDVQTDLNLGQAIADENPVRQDQLAAVAGGLGGKANADSSTVTQGGETGTPANTYAHDGVYYQVADAGTGIDFYLDFNTGSGVELPLSFHLHGRFEENGAPFDNSMSVQAYNWITTSWDTIHLLTHSLLSEDEPHSPPLTAQHSDSSGDVRIRFLLETQETGSEIFLDHVNVVYAQATMSLLSTVTEIVGPPPDPLTVEWILGAVKHLFFNDTETDVAGERRLLDGPGGTAIAEQDGSDSGTVFTQGKIRTP